MRVIQSIKELPRDAKAARIQSDGSVIVYDASDIVPDDVTEAEKEQSRLWEEFRVFEIRRAQTDEENRFREWLSSRR